MTFNWKKWFHALISPTAIGLYITLLLSGLCFEYYIFASNRNAQVDENNIFSLMLTAHNKSVDWRLRARGPRRVSPELALLTVDERAVAALGRWPWPREIIGQAIDEATKYGAKVLAFDIVFAEPSYNASQEVYDSIRKTHRLPKDVESALADQVARRDSDAKLAQSIGRNADQVVSGSFFDNEIHDIRWDPETEFCRDLIYKRSTAAKIWDKEEALIGVSDPFQPQMPKILLNTFASALDETEAELRRKLGTPRSKSEEVAFDDRVFSELQSACDTILGDYADQIEQNWEAVRAQENPQDFKFASYKEWLDSYRQQSLTSGLLYAGRWVVNTPGVAEKNKNAGFFNASLDADGTIRNAYLIARTGNSYFPSIGLKAFLVARKYMANLKLDLNAKTLKKEIQTFEIRDEEDNLVMTIPTRGDGQLMINYAGPAQMFPYVSFAELLNGSPEMEIEQFQFDSAKETWGHAKSKVKKAEFLKDKIFIVGATATGIYDLRVTPFEENFPGAETHLNVIDNLLQKNFFRPLADEPIYMPLLLLSLGVLLSLLLSHLGALWGLIVTGSTLLSLVLIDKYYLFSHGVVSTIVWPLLLIAVLYVALTFYRYLTEERGKKELRQTFQKYVSPAIVEEVLAHPDNIQLGGKKVRLTVMFSDVRGFTTISEKLDPRALSDLLNSYLTPMTEIVFKNRGTLDKYMGDAIMAFFGAPVQYNDHAKWACRCALQSLDKLKELQKEYAAKGLPSIDIGIGLNTGDVSVGNMGSQTVRSYTVMGDAVNLGSRLEGINKEYGTRVIISEFTYEEVKDSFICREVDWVRVKGKALPVAIYELISEETVPEHLAQMLRHFTEGFSHYQAKAFQPALESFAKCLDLVPDDEPSKLYIERCEEFLQSPPPEDWDGVFVMKTK